MVSLSNYGRKARLLLIAERKTHSEPDFFSGFRGAPVALTFHPTSHIYHGVVSKCKILHGRYLATPWLSSPHFQTTFLNFFGNPPAFSYRRQLFHASDGGTIALDWLTSSDISRGAFEVNHTISKEDTTPLVVVIPGLTSDSTSSYIKHLAFGLAKHGWNVVVSNHRGLGGVSITSDCFYNAGWTEDARVVIDYLHHQYPKAPLFAIGTSIGANILVKYLGEDREKVPVAGAVAICSPWDLLIGDRFICRRLLQKLYDRALTIGLQGYAKLHEPRYSLLANWEGIRKSRSIRDFDNFATCLVGKFETVDTYYRRSTSTPYVLNVSVPLLCISALDDPVCTREAIPWDECRANKNIVLATIKHGGHLAFFEGITGSRLWWVRATDEFLGVLHSSSHMHKKKTEITEQKASIESSIDQGPYVNVGEDGMVAAVGSAHAGNKSVEHFTGLGSIQDKTVLGTEQTQQQTEAKSDVAGSGGEVSGECSSLQRIKCFDVIAASKRWLNHLLFRKNGKSVWLLVYIAIITSWPILGSALRIFSRKKKLRNFSAATSHRR
ncbi:embryogenesis-associated protein EMB8 isoform X2 [Gossypium raimondii]|uniref:embryogenesis-associated protein EMB8 isoform X2 n=1 Tax=Gossypium raimondii TaxID=29730 RepID=UPI00063ABD85|nr:embryogenesis-associated protein EMB8 isoform X2 [Gossypium raimondii]